MEKKEVCFKMGKARIGLFLILILVVNLSFVIAQDEKEFDPEDGATWESATDAELQTLSADNLFDSTDSAVVEDLWEKFNSNAKNGFMDKKLPEISVEGLGSDKLILEGNVLKEKGGKALLDISKLPKNLKKITYESGKGFIYDFGDENTFSTDAGYVDENGVLQGISDGMDGRFKYEGGEVSFKGELFSLLDENAKLNIDGIEFTRGNLDSPGIIKTTDKGIYVTLNTHFNNGEVSGITLGKQTYLLFRGDDFSKQIKSQFVQAYGDSLTVNGEGIQVHTLKDYRDVVAKGSETNPVTIYNGAGDDFPIEFAGEWTNVPTQIRGAPHDMFKIDNQNNQEHYFSITKISEDGPRILTDHQKLVTAGDVNINLAGGIQNPANYLSESIANLASLATISMEMGGEDLNKISEGSDRETQIKAFQDSEHKSIGLQTNQRLTGSMIKEVVSEEGVSAIGGDKEGSFLSGLKGTIDKASEWGLMEPVTREDYDKGVDDAMAGSAKAVMDLFQESAGRLPVSEYRDVSEKSGWNIADTIAGNSWLKDTFVENSARYLEEGATGLISGTKITSGKAKAYADFSEGMEKVYERYGSFPKGTDVRIELRENRAFGEIIPPESRTRVDGEWQTIKMEPIQFPINPSVANEMINDFNQRIEAGRIESSQPAE